MAAEEMVLIPRVRYERLLTLDKGDNVTNPSPEKKGDKHVERSPGKVSEGKGDESARSPEPTSPPLRSEDEKGQATGDGGEEKKKNPVEIAQEQEEKLKLDSILDEIPSKYRVKAERILAYIDVHGGSVINWNSRGRLIYKNMPITGSSMGELVEHFLTNKGKEVTGFSLFKKALLKIKLPNSLQLTNSADTSSLSPKKKRKKKR